MRKDSTRDTLINLVILAACSLLPLAVCYAGLSRSYDAIPDQDLLWASEALRLLRGVAPSYADHPGAFWSLLYGLNIRVLELFFSGQVIDATGSITPLGISRLIYISRIENGFLAGFCSYLIYPAARALNISRWLSAAAALITSSSTALLVGVSEIRHEVPSVLFFLAAVITFRAAKGSINSWRRFFLAYSTALLPIVAAFCKNQSLLLTPLLAIAMLSMTSETEISEIREILTRLTQWPRSILTLTAAMTLPWLTCSFPDIDLINLPFWLAINATSTFAIATSAYNHMTPKRVIWSAVGLGGIQITLLKLVSPQWWRQGVTGFPSWMFRYSHAAEDHSINPLKQVIAGAVHYSNDLFSPSWLGALGLAMGLVASTLILTRANIRSKNTEAGKPLHWLIAASWIYTSFIVLVNTQRVATRYEIYFFIPLILTTAKTLDSVHFRQWKSTFLLPAWAAIVVTTATVSSAQNLPDFRERVNSGQDPSVLCIGHHMDRTMRLTSASKCDVFQKATKDKDVYDSWGGPR